MRTLVTGGAGFLGSHLCDALLARGDEVVCLDNLVTGSTDNIAHLMGNEKFRFCKHDVSQYVFVDGPVDRILHFASPASPVDYLKLPIQTLKVGSLGTHNMLGVAKAKGARFLLASTSEVYGDPEINPQTEDYWGHVNPIGYRGVYDEAKRFAEAITMAYHRTHGIPTRIVRIFNSYGPRMRADDGRALPNFCRQALSNEDLTIYGDGSQTRSFTYVADTVAGILRLLDSEETEPVNIGNPNEMSILDLAREVLALTKSESKVVHQPYPKGFEDDPKVRQPDITKAKRVLGWKPEYPLRKGLKLTLEYFQSAAAEFTTCA